ncbi:hypothetical protein N9A07_01630 [Candidatus Pelagibacter ubique]|nr:hypothetical protein [Candidatus Pelagibacter ubique]
MKYLVLSQIIIFILFLKFYKLLPILETKNNNKIYSAGYFFAISLISYFIFAPSPIEDKITFIIFPLAAFILGALDDYININPWIRLSIIALLTFILITYDNNFNLNFINFNSVIYKIDFPLNILFTCLCFLLLINAMNFIDGINCLAGSVFLFFYSYLGYRVGIQIDLIFIVITSILFFLILNYKNIWFLGDGSIYLLSFLIAQLIVLSFKENYETFQTEEILLLLYLPGFDLFRLFLDRSFKKKNPFIGDENHLHHYLKNKIGTNKTITLYMLCLISPLFLYHFFLINNFICIFFCIIIYLSILNYAKN